MRRKLAGILATAVISVFAAPAIAAAAPEADSAPASAAHSDPLGDLITSALSGGALPGSVEWKMKATMYHAGAKGIRAFDSLGCRVAAMRTVAVDPKVIPRRTVIFIKETVGLPMPNGEKHDGYWYASDIGGAIKGLKLDLFSGVGASSMKALRGIDLSSLSVSKVGEFKGCPPQ
ncbi:3D domain-containing protein [Caulobacter sp. SL161]|uniref:3D domain-containing protein n=1 Tax=Caulobacter sp. SL161 TaxID=2995156 RepID=UPI0022726636|nr:3D domain-containing protein [Caulobacter sp. SL161]MCY1647123.1 3D domain-containing protein [Caulobacter sp. SL161]